MKSQRLLLPAAVMTFVLAVPAFAHHAIEPFFHMDMTVEVRGVVTEWHFRNPHPLLRLEGADESGRQGVFEVHFAPATVLGRRGWTAQMFQPGDEVVVTGNPSRGEGTYGVQHRSINRADGSDLIR